MKTEQRQWSSANGWATKTNNNISQTAGLVFVFGGRHALSDAARYNEIKTFYPNAHIVCSTTSGEIIDVEVHDDTLVLTAVEFENTKLKFNKLHINESVDSYKAGQQLVKDLISDDLVHVFVQP